MTFDSSHWEVLPKSVDVFHFWLEQYRLTVDLLKDPYAFLRQSVTVLFIFIRPKTDSMRNSRENETYHIFYAQNNVPASLAVLEDN
jgi:hypothetical protein